MVSLFPHPASFRFHLTMDTLAVQLYISHYLGIFRTFTCESAPMARKRNVCRRAHHKKDPPHTQHCVRWIFSFFYTYGHTFFSVILPSRSQRSSHPRAPSQRKTCPLMRRQFLSSFVMASISSAVSGSSVTQVRLD